MDGALGFPLAGKARDVRNRFARSWSKRCYRNQPVDRQLPTILIRGLCPHRHSLAAAPARFRLRERHSSFHGPPLDHTRGQGSPRAAAFSAWPEKTIKGCNDGRQVRKVGPSSTSNECGVGSLRARGRFTLARAFVPSAFLSLARTVTTSCSSERAPTRVTFRRSRCAEDSECGGIASHAIKPQ